MPFKDLKAQVSLVPAGGMTLSVRWKTSDKLYSELQASTQGIVRDSSRYMGYSDTTQLMTKQESAPWTGTTGEPPRLSIWTSNARASLW